MTPEEINAQQIKAREAANAGLCSPAPAGSVKPSLDDLLAAIHGCELERQTAQLSGLSTGWEHPCTQTMWKRITTLARMMTPNMV